MVFLIGFAWFAYGLYPNHFFGALIYDAFYSNILSGRLDLPPRLLGYEGHYTPDGTGYLYHGFGPLLTRFAFGWFWPFDVMSMSSFSILLWTVIGTYYYQRALIDLAEESGSLDHPFARGMTLMFAIALWACGPAIILVANQALFHETIALAYGVCGVFIAVWVRYFCRNTHPILVFALLALMAAITVFARPNVAVGLYVAVTGLACWCFIREGRALLVPSLVAGFILGSGGLLYLGLNEIKFGDAGTVHGSYEESDLQYGFAFWNAESPDSDRARAFIEHGRFNALRIVPNAGLYVLDLPTVMSVRGPSDFAIDVFRGATENRLGYIRVERPRVGMALLWTAWIFLALFGLLKLRQPTFLILAGGLFASVLLTLSYGTITLRYRVDMWPFIAVMAFLGATWLFPRLTLMRRRAARYLAPLIVLMLASNFAMSTAAAVLYAEVFREEAPFAIWTKQECISLAEATSIPEERFEVVCRNPV